MGAWTYCDPETATEVPTRSVPARRGALGTASRNGENDVVVPQIWEPLFAPVMSCRPPEPRWSRRSWLVGTPEAAGTGRHTTTSPVAFVPETVTSKVAPTDWNDDCTAA